MPLTRILSEFLQERSGAGSARPLFAVETLAVSKSLLVIGGLGMAACCLLSGGMKKLIEHKLARPAVSPAALLERKYDRHLLPPVTVHEEHDGAQLRLVVHARTRPLQDKQRLAAELGYEVWQQAAAARELPFSVQVTLRDADGGAPLTTMVARPTLPR